MAQKLLHHALTFLTILLCMVSIFCFYKYNASFFRQIYAHYAYMPQEAYLQDVSCYTLNSIKSFQISNTYSSGKNGSSCALTLKYEYAGSKYKAYRNDYIYGSVSGNKAYQEIVRYFGRGHFPRLDESIKSKKFVIFRNPQNPNEAILDKSLPGFSLFLNFIISIFICYTFCFFIAKSLLPKNLINGDKK